MTTKTTAEGSIGQRTVRELGGEIWSELSQGFPEEALSWQIRNEIVDVIMVVLARHSGKMIENDMDLLVGSLEPEVPAS